MPITELVTLLANIALTLTFLVGLVFGLAQVRAVERDRRERLTLETLRNFQTRDFAELLRFVIDPAFPKSRQEFDALPLAQHVMYIQFSQQMESLGILVAENFIDVDLIEKTLGSFVLTSWKKYDAVFSQIRPTDPYIGEYFQWLAERIEERSKTHKREPFYVIGKGRHLRVFS